MNDIINTFLLGGDKFMPEMHLGNQDLYIVLVDHFLHPEIQFRNKKKQKV